MCTARNATRSHGRLHAHAPLAGHFNLTGHTWIWLPEQLTVHMVSFYWNWRVCLRTLLTPPELLLQSSTSSTPYWTNSSTIGELRKHRKNWWLSVIKNAFTSDFEQIIHNSMYNFMSMKNSCIYLSEENKIKAGWINFDTFLSEYMLMIFRHWMRSSQLGHPYWHISSTPTSLQFWTIKQRKINRTSGTVSSCRRQPTLYSLPPTMSIYSQPTPIQIMTLLWYMWGLSIG